MLRQLSTKTTTPKDVHDISKYVNERIVPRRVLGYERKFRFLDKDVEIC